MRVRALENGDHALAVIELVTQNAATTIAINADTHPVSALLALAKSALNMLGGLNDQATLEIMRGIIEFGEQKKGEADLPEYVQRETEQITKLISSYESKIARGHA